MTKWKKPTLELVDKYVKKFNKEERYNTPDKAIKLLIGAFPHNNDINKVLVKVVAINSLYSTNIFSTFKIAEHITKVDNIDGRLKEGDIEVIKEIATGHGIKTKTGKERNFYSFATKYCHWHNPEEYMIYDSFVEEALWEYKKEHDFFGFQRKDLKDYKKYKNIYSKFREHFSLEEKNYKDIDKFIWTYKKEA